MTADSTLARINRLPCWSGQVTAEPISGGITNLNFVVSDADRKFFVRMGDDIAEHQVMRFNELAACRAAHAAGLSPEVFFAGDGMLVLDFIDGKTLTPEDIRQPDMLPRVLDRVKSCHRDIPAHLRGPALIFWVFHVIRDYGARLTENGSSYGDLVGELVGIGNQLERNAGPFDIVFGHNDLLSGNFIDDGERLWLIDFDYAGFNSPLFDLGGLASNNELSGVQETGILEDYFEQSLSDELWKRYSAMKCASLLRETMWSMVSEITSEIDFDYAAYTAENLSRFRAAYDAFGQA